MQAFHVCLLFISTLFIFFVNFIIITENVGMSHDVLASMFIYCNPGEVSCSIADHSSIITIWLGEVDADKFYTSIPNGAAKYYDGNSYNIQNTVFRNYAMIDLSGERVHDH